MADNLDSDPDKGRPDSYATQLLMTAVVIVGIGIVVALLAKVFVGILLVLLGVIVGGGSRYARK